MHLELADGGVKFGQKKWMWSASWGIVESPQ